MSSRYATIAYGMTCFLFGATPLLYIGGVATLLCGAADAVGATMRSTVVMLTTPDHLRCATSAICSSPMRANLPAMLLGLGEVAEDEFIIKTTYFGAGDVLGLATP